MRDGPGDGCSIVRPGRKEKCSFLGGERRPRVEVKGCRAVSQAVGYPSPSDLGVTRESLLHAWSPSPSICKVGWRSHSVQCGFGIWGGDCQPDRL